MAKASLLEEVESCSTSVLSSRTGANRDGRNYVTGASQSVGRRRESPSTSAAPPEFTYIVTSTTLRFHGAGAGVTVSSRVGAVLERRKREQKRSGGEGGGSADILVRGIKCSVAFASSFRFAITGSCFSTSIVALRPSNRRLQASENFSFVWCGRRCQ